MTTQFELSAYGVEGMNKKEMIETDGGAIPAVVWLILEVVSVVSGCIGTYYATKAQYDEHGKLRATKQYIRLDNICADSVKIDSEGNMVIYNLNRH